LDKKEYLNESGQLVRSSHWNYDDKGRKSTLTYKDHTSGLDEVFKYHYDGKRPFGSLLAGQKGRLTALEGPSFYKEWSYTEDGHVASESTKINGFGTVISLFEYHPDGSIKQKKIQRISPTNSVQLDLSIQYHLDQFGRESYATLNQTPLYRLTYDGLSRLASILGPEFETTFKFDEETQKEKAYIQHFSENKEFSASWDYDTRGNISKETFSNHTQTVRNNYAYSDSGYLNSFQSELQQSRYVYDENQWLVEVDDSQAALKFRSDQNRWKSQSGTYKLDSLGRVSHKKIDGNKTFLKYGPQGRVSEVIELPKAKVSYLYDDEGRRIIKKRDEMIEEIYIGNIVVTRDALLVPIEVNHKTIGYLENDRFKVLSPDARNTVISDSHHALNIPEPYGLRQNRPFEKAQSALIDYALLGYDPDLKAYRAEFRDYDPWVKRFLSPDPLFLENPEKCVESPVECNLYGYAKNNPVSFVDPTGKNAAWIMRAEMALERYAPQIERAAQTVLTALATSIVMNEAVKDSGEIKIPVPAIAGENGVPGKIIVGTDHDAVKPTQDKINPEIVQDYMDKITSGQKIDPIEIIRTPSGDFLQEGHHRYVAGQACGKDVPATIKESSGPVGMPNWKDVEWKNFNPQ
jgi:RHS repeat-associated protein